jgi:hypothetical protein
MLVVLAPLSRALRGQSGRQTINLLAADARRAFSDASGGGGDDVLARLWAK